MDVDSAQPTVVSFPAISIKNASEDASYRKVVIPPHRMAPLKQHWLKIYTPLVEHLKLQVRFNPKAKAVEIRSHASTVEVTAVQRAAEYVKAFCCGFSCEDAMVLLRLDDMFLDSFEIKDVKTLNGDHLSRAIGRVAGKNGKTKTTIENTSKTRIVLADSRVHILGSYHNIRVAKDAIMNLILGSTPGRVYTQLRAASSRLSEKNF